MEGGGARAGLKRAADQDAPVFERFELTPLGGGNEVGRSCLIMRYKGKTVMLDCGILPSFSGINSLPFLGELNPSEVDVVFITHFHLDHAAALPYFTERLAGFRGRIFATHATIACMKLMLSDFVRVTSVVTDDDKKNQLYDEKDIDRCIARMEAIDFKQKMTVDGLQFMFFNAGHVLGAAMVLMEIGGVRTLYTGDYSCEEDRHLMAAEIPRAFSPDVLIVEATYGMQVHESREERERRFTESVEKVVRRGGRCLIPVFALGRAQELLLILDEYWAARPELQRIPIFFSSKLASRSLEVYRTYISSMNTRLQAQMGDRNPWDFRFVRSLAGPHEFRDEGPCVVLASPGMLQSGFSRMLFDRWAEEPRNGVILAGYSVEGTMARKLESNPAEVESMQSRKLVRRIGVERVSFSAHADSLQTSAFVDALQPPQIILVHGEKSEMRKLRDGLAKRMEGKNTEVHMPANHSPVQLFYQETRMVKAMGTIAGRRLLAGQRVSGVLVHRNFEFFLLQPADLPKYTPLATHSLRQKQHVPFRSSYALLKSFVVSMFPGSTEGLLDEEGRLVAEPALDSGSTCTALVPAAGGAAAGSSSSGGGRAHRRCLVVARGQVTVIHAPPDRVVLSWGASPTSDMVADCLVALLAQAEVSQAALRASSKPCGGGHGHHHDDHESGAMMDADDGDDGGAIDDAALAATSALSASFCWSDAPADAPEAAAAAAAATARAPLLLPETPHPPGADGGASGGPAAGAAQQLVLLQQQQLLRAQVDVLLATLCEQFGPASVRYEGPLADATRDAFPGIDAGAAQAGVHDAIAAVVAPAPASQEGDSHGCAAVAASPEGELGARAHPLQQQQQRSGERVRITVRLDDAVGWLAHSIAGGWSTGLLPQEEGAQAPTAAGGDEGRQAAAGAAGAALAARERFAHALRRMLALAARSAGATGGAIGRPQW